VGPRRGHGAKDVDVPAGALARAAFSEDGTGAAESPADEPDVKRIENLRHAFEHTPEFLADGRIPEGDVVMPAIWPEGVEFVGDEIRFAELAAWLRRLHALAERLTDTIGQEPPAT
jgi:hypothetical protein